MDLHRKLLIIILLSLANCVFGQTGSINVDENHNGHKIFGLPTPVAANEAATKAYADSVGGGGGGSGTVTSLTATAPIVVTPSPITTTGVISLSGTSYGLGFLPLVDATAARGYIGALGSSSIDNTAYTSSWSGFTTVAPSKKAIYDEIHSFTAAHDGFVNVLDQTTGITNTNGVGIIQAPKLIGTDIQAWDADLDALAALTGTNTIYYRSAANTWSPVTIGSNMTFSSGTLNSTAGGSGTVTTTGSPATGNLAKFSGSTSITNGDLSGDVTTSGTLATTIGASKVTYAKMQNVSANSVLLGSSATGSGAPPSEIALGTNLSMSGSTLNATSGGGGNVSNSGTPVAGQVPIWTSATAIKGDTGFTFSGTGTSALLELGGTDLGLARNAAGVLEIDNGTAGQWGAVKAGVRDAATNTFTDGVIIGHQHSGSTPAPNYGSAILFNADDSTTADVAAGRIAVGWSTATHASRVSYMDFQTANAGTPTTAMRLFMESGNLGSLSVGTTTDPGSTGIVNVATGYQIGGGAGASRLLQGNGTAFVGAGYNFPTASGAAGVIIQSNGSSFATSTATWPTANTAGYLVRGDGTNYAAYPSQIINSSTASQASSFAADTYLTGSNCVVAAGDMKAKGQYKCIFDMVKTGAGTAAPVITVRVGTAGTTSDAAELTFTFGVGTGVVDTGIFEVIVTWRTVGSGTSAVVQGICRGTHNLATTGLFSNGAGWVIVGTPSSGFASNTATNIGVSFNGGTSFSGTTTLVQAQLQQ